MAVGLGVLLAVASCGGDNRGDLESAADRIDPPAGWVLTRREFGKAEPSCLADCDSVLLLDLRVDGAAPTSEGLVELASRSGWSVVDPDSGCAPKPDLRGAIPYCDLEAEGDGVSVDLRAVRNPDGTSTVTVRLSTD